MDLMIECPTCQKQSKIAYDRLPTGRVKTNCHSCGRAFVLDKQRELNCRKMTDNDAQLDNTLYPESGWKVDHPICKGLEYDLPGLNGLIRSGFLKPEGRVLAPGTKGYQEGKTFKQLQKFFEQQEQRQAKAK